MEQAVVDAIGPALLDAAVAAGIGIVIVAIEEQQPRTIFVNEVACSLLGYSPEALRARPMLELVSDTDRARVTEQYERRVRGEELDARIELELVHASGERIPVAAGVCIASVRGVRVEVVLLTDMRARTRAAAELRASERRFRDLVEAAPDGIVISRSGEIVYANRTGGVLLGVPSDALVGRSLAEFLSAEDIQRMRERIAAIGRGQRFAPSTYVATRPDGTSVVAEIASIATEHEGAPAVLAFARDVTARMQIQAGLERAERLAAVGRLAAGMAHEINNPLAFISLNAEALQRKLEDVLPAGEVREEVLDLLDELVRGSDRVAGIVRDLRAFSREGEDARGPVQLEPVIAAAVRMVEHEIATRGKLITSLASLPPVIGEARRLEQVFVNLLVNAAHALPESGGGTIEISASVGTAEVTIAVRDSGHGIPPEHLGRVLDPFFTTKPIGQGTGLGLSICHGIVSSLGGSISIESEEGRGTTVSVTLVRAPEAQREPEPPVESPVAAPKRARVLVVEDQEALAITLSRLLSSQHEVVTVYRVRDALTQLRGEKAFDVVLCDMLMPDGTGVDVYEGILGERPELARRFVFMTGGAFRTDIAEFLERVQNARLEKPFAISELEDVIASLVP